VPSLTNPVGFFHPKVMEVRLDGHAPGEIRTWRCDDDARRDMPGLNLDDDPEAHPIASHVARLKSLHEKGAEGSDIFKLQLEEFNPKSSIAELDEGLHEESNPLDHDKAQERSVDLAARDAEILEKPMVEGAQAEKVAGASKSRGAEVVQKSKDS